MRAGADATASKGHRPAVAWGASVGEKVRRAYRYTTDGHRMCTRWTHMRIRVQCLVWRESNPHFLRSLVKFAYPSVLNAQGHLGGLWAASARKWCEMVSLGHLWSLGSFTEIIPNKRILYSPIGLSFIPLFLYILFIIKSILYYIKKRGWVERSDNSTKTSAFA